METISAEGGGVEGAAASMVSFTSNCEDSSSSVFTNKVELVYSLLSVLSSADRVQSSETLLSLSRSADTCQLMRQAGCVPLLLHMLHPGDVWKNAPDAQQVEVVSRAANALHNVVDCQLDDNKRKREVRLVKLLDNCRTYSLQLRLLTAGLINEADGIDIVAAVATLMKLSFQEDQRLATTQLGGLQAAAELLISDCIQFGHEPDIRSNAVRKYLGMAMTNLTFGAAHSKQTLCSFPRFLDTVKTHLSSNCDELTQVFANVLRNLSWKADDSSKRSLRESGCVTCLMQAALHTTNEPTLKSLLSALWNLSSHCSGNKAEICRVKGGLELLVKLLSFKSATESLGVVENGSGILRNVSSHIGLNEPLRPILREHHCFEALLALLRSSSLTVVSNACGALWNLSAHCAQDQRTLWQLGAVQMLSKLVHSKHRMISVGSAAALKNLLSNPVEGVSMIDGSASGLIKQRRIQSLHCELDRQLSPLNDMESQCDTQTVTPRISSRSPAVQAMQAVSGLVKPVTLHNMCSNYQSLPSSARSCDSGLGQCAQSKSSHNLSSVDKKLQMNEDRAVTNRFHNSLKRYKQKEIPEDVEQDNPRKYCVENNANEDNLEKVRSFADEGSATQPVTFSRSESPRNQNHSGAASSSMRSPLMYSRQSSVESLRSVEPFSAGDSEVPSVYSTRQNTRPASPSNLPDSPGESVPVSPTPPVDVHNPPCRPSSVNSGLSALTIDSTEKVKPGLYLDEGDYMEFDRDKGAQALRKSIQLAKPMPRASPQFKIPSVPASRKKATKLKCEVTGQDTVRTYKYEEDGGSNRKTKAAPETEAPLASLIKSAMPKPTNRQKTLRYELPSCHRGKNVGVTRPMPRNQPQHPPVDEDSCEEQPEQTKIFAMEGTPRSARSRAQSPPPSRGQSLESPESEEDNEDPAALQDLISSVMPKPNYCNMSDSRRRLISEEGVVGRSDLCDSVMSTTMLDDIAPPDDLMKMSVCSALVHTSSTDERVKDASHLHPVNRSSEGESLSEDNYSRSDEPDFDIAPEDVQVEMLEEDVRQVVQRLQEETLSEEELLIECETLSLTSVHSQLDKKEECHSPKPIRGGRKSAVSTALAAPKVAVRTTRTSQLRAAKRTAGLGPPVIAPKPSITTTPSRGKTTRTQPKDKLNNNNNNSNSGKDDRRRSNKMLITIV